MTERKFTVCHSDKFQYVELFDPIDIGMIVLNPRRKNEPPCA